MKTLTLHNKKIVLHAKAHYKGYFLGGLFLLLCVKTILFLVGGANIFNLPVYAQNQGELLMRNKILSVATNTKITAHKGAKNYVPGQVLVKFRPSKINLQQLQSQHLLQTFASQKNIQTLRTLRISNIAVMQASPETDMEAVAANLRTDPNVEIAEPNYIRQVASIASNDTHRNTLWGLENFGQQVYGFT